MENLKFKNLEELASLKNKLNEEIAELKIEAQAVFEQEKEIVRQNKIIEQFPILEDMRKYYLLHLENLELDKNTRIYYDEGFESTLTHTGYPPTEYEGKCDVSQKKIKENKDIAVYVAAHIRTKFAELVKNSPFLFDAAFNYLLKSKNIELLKVFSFTTENFLPQYFTKNFKGTIRELSTPSISKEQKEFQRFCKLKEKILKSVKFHQPETISNAENTLLSSYQSKVNEGEKTVQNIRTILEELTRTQFPNLKRGYLFIFKKNDTWEVRDSCLPF